MTTSSGIAVTLTNTEFTLGELERFIEAARSVDAIPEDALVTVNHEIANPTVYTLRASTEYRST